MKKILKTFIFILTFALLFIFTNFSYSVDLNLTENSINQTSHSETNIINDNSETSSTKVSSVSNLPESDLGLANILSIILIAVGIVLILLAIAILIKLKN